MLDFDGIPHARVATTRTSVLVVVFLAAVGLLVFTASANALQTAQTTSQNSVAATGALERLIDITPGTAVQPGTSTPVATGLDLTFAMNLGRVPDSRTFADALRIINRDTVPHTIRVSTVGAGLGSIALVGFTADSNPADGAGVETIAPGATELMFITTTTASAGLQSGSLRFERVGDERFYRRDRPIQTRQAPAAPAGLTGIASAGPDQIALNWSAPPSTGVAGYNVYRATSAGGPYTKLNATPVVATNFADTTITAGTRYWYRVRAVASGVTPELESADSNTTNRRVPPTPTSVTIPAGATNPAGYINFSTRAAATVRVVLPAATEAGDVLNVEVASGATAVGTTVNVVTAGAQAINAPGINATALAEGAAILRAWLTKPSETGATVTGAAIKDTLAEVAGSFVAATAVNPVNYINIATGINPGTATGAVTVPASSATTDTVSLRMTMGAQVNTRTAAGLAGAGTQTIAGYSTNGWAQGAVAITARVQDVAGNDSGWINGTPATRDTVVPPPPTAARIQATTTNPIDTINIANATAAPVTVTTNGAASSVEARLVRSGVTVIGSTVGTGTVIVPVNASTLADGNAGTVDVSARQLDAAWNPSPWFNGTDARKDTVAPNPPNFSRITFTNRFWFLRDRVSGSNGALGSRDEVRIYDYGNGQFYPTGGWDAANNNGGFGNVLISAGNVPRTLGYDVRDSAWNPIARICRLYASSGTGAATTCP